MERAIAKFSRPLSAFLTLASLFAIACDQPAETSAVESALTSRGDAEQQVEQCVTGYATDTERKACIQSAGFSLFDDSAIETADRCIPGCVCVTGQGCPCCDTGSFFSTVFWPRPTPGVWTPSAPTTEAVSIDIDRICVGKTLDHKTPLTVQTHSTSRLASLVDLDIAAPGAKIVAATVSDDGRYHDALAGDKVLSGLAMVSAVPAEGCTVADCHFGCEGQWVYPQTPEEGTCPAHEWWGIGCLKLTSCSFGCGTSSSGLGVIAQPAANIFSLQP